MWISQNIDLGRFSQQVLSFWLAISFNRLGEAACLCCEAESSAEFLLLDGVFSSSLLSQHLLLWLRAQLRVISVCPPEHLRHCLLRVEHLKWVWSWSIGGSLLTSEWVQPLVIHVIPQFVGWLQLWICSSLFTKSCVSSAIKMLPHGWALVWAQLCFLFTFNITKPMRRPSWDQSPAQLGCHACKLKIIPARSASWLKQSSRNGACFTGQGIQVVCGKGDLPVVPWGVFVRSRKLTWIWNSTPGLLSSWSAALGSSQMSAGGFEFGCPLVMVCCSSMQMWQLPMSLFCLHSNAVKHFSQFEWLLVLSSVGLFYLAVELQGHFLQERLLGSRTGRNVLWELLCRCFGLWALKAREQWTVCTHCLQHLNLS